MASGSSSSSSPSLRSIAAKSDASLHKDEVGDSSGEDAPPRLVSRDTQSRALPRLSEEEEAAAAAAAFK